MENEPTVTTLKELTWNDLLYIQCGLYLLRDMEVGNIEGLSVLINKVAKEKLRMEAQEQEQLVF